MKLWPGERLVISNDSERLCPFRIGHLRGSMCLMRAQRFAVASVQVIHLKC